MVFKQRERSFLIILIVLSWMPPVVFAATVHVRLIDSESSKITPAMVCITGADEQVRLPPDGSLLLKPSTTRDFYYGVEFKADANWIGPVRGIGSRLSSDVFFS